MRFQTMCAAAVRFRERLYIEGCQTSPHIRMGHHEVRLDIKRRVVANAVVVDGPLLRRMRRSVGSASSTFPTSMRRSPLSRSGRRCNVSALRWRSGRSWTTAALCERRARLLSSAALGGGYSLCRHRPPVSRSDCCQLQRRLGNFDICRGGGAGRDRHCAVEMAPRRITDQSWRLAARD